MTGRRCACGQPVPKGRKRHCGDECARAAWKAAEQARNQTRPAGSIRGDRVYLPGHLVSAANGWASLRRVAAFDARRGVCVCDATGAPLDWPAAKVVDGDNGAMVLCQAHTWVRLFAEFVIAYEFGGGVGARIVGDLGALWAASCPAVGGASDSEAARDQGAPPTEGTPPAPVPPVNQGRL